MVMQLDADLLTIPEAARLLRVSAVTLHRWIKDGRLLAYRVGPRKIRIRRTDLSTMFAPTHREEVTPMKESMRTPADFTIRPLTDEEVQRGLTALEDAAALGKRILARTGGQPLASSAPIIRKAREERSRRFRDL